jgi:hypothetical protein
MIVARQQANQDAIMDIGGWLRSWGRERRLRQLKGSRQRLFGFSSKLRLMPSHEGGGNNNAD